MAAGFLIFCLKTDGKMPILKPIDENYICPLATSPDDILRVLFEFNGITYGETDIAGSQLQNLDPYKFFAINRLLNFVPVASNNKYSQATYNCLLTIAKPINHDLEVETVNVPGQFDTITKELLDLAFINQLRAYFKCCDYQIEITNVTPIWNSNRVAPAVNYSGVEINYSVTI